MARGLLRLALSPLLLGFVGSFRLSAHPVRRRLSVSRALGSVALVGAGPGDPDLLTVAAVRHISNPKALVIADRLVSHEIISMVQGELRVAAKTPGCQQAAQDEIFRWIEEAVRRGTDVVRLKIGDPFVFGRGGEEVLEFREKLGIEATVVPGVSAVFSSPLLGGIPVTHRGVANQVIMSTGYGKEEARPALQPYHPEQTAVFVMAVGRLTDLCERLQSEAAYPATCPVAIVEKASMPEQRCLIGTVGTIGRLAKEYEIQAPSTIVFGEVVHVLHDTREGLVCDVPLLTGLPLTGPLTGVLREQNTALQALCKNETLAMA